VIIFSSAREEHLEKVTGNYYSLKSKKRPLIELNANIIASTIQNIMTNQSNQFCSIIFLTLKMRKTEKLMRITAMQIINTLKNKLIEDIIKSL
jgi:hypothetical protein